MLSSEVSVFVKMTLLLLLEKHYWICLNWTDLAAVTQFQVLLIAYLFVFLEIDEDFARIYVWDPCY